MPRDATVAPMDSPPELTQEGFRPKAHRGCGLRTPPVSSNRETALGSPRRGLTVAAPYQDFAGADHVANFPPPPDETYRTPPATCRAQRPRPPRADEFGWRR